MIPKVALHSRGQDLLPEVADFQACGDGFAEEFVVCFYLFVRGFHKDFAVFVAEAHQGLRPSGYPAEPAGGICDGRRRYGQICLQRGWGEALCLADNGRKRHHGHGICSELPDRKRFGHDDTHGCWLLHPLDDVFPRRRGTVVGARVVPAGPPGQQPRAELYTLLI